MNYGLFICLLLQQLPEVGPQGFVFRPVVDGDGRSILTNDGSPLFEGRLRLPNDRLVITSLSQKSLREKVAREIAWKGKPATPWLDQTMKVRVSSGVLEAAFLRWKEDPQLFDQVLGNMPFEKSELLRRLLFGNEIILRSEEKISEMGSDPDPRKRALSLTAISRSAEVPAPERILIVFPVPKIPIIFRPWSEWFVEVELDELNFSFEKKKIEFDPLTNSIRVQIDCDKAILRGPTRRLGRVAYGLHRYHEYLPWHEDDDPYYWNVSNELIEGLLGKLTLVIRLQFYQDGDGFWRLGLVNSRIRENDPGIMIIPREENPMVRMTFEDEVEDPESPTGKSHQQSFPLTDGILGVINRKLSEMLDSAFQSAFLEDDLGAIVRIENPWEAAPAPTSNLQIRLEKFSIADQELNLSLSSRLLAEKTAPEPCLREPFPEVWSSRERRKDGSPVSAKPWSLVSDLQDESEGVWKASSRFSRIDVTLDENLIELAHAGLWAAGLYCVHSKWIWPRPGSLPPIEFQNAGRPKLSLGWDEIHIGFQGPLMFSRLHWEEGFYFEQEKLMDAMANFNIKIDSTDRKLWVEGVEKIRISELTESENEAVRVLVDEVFGKEMRMSFESLEKEWLHEGYALEQLQVQPEGISVRLIPQISKMTEAMGQAERVQKSPRSLDIPQTKILSNFSEAIQDHFVELRWTSQVPEALYSFRMRRLAVGTWSEWSSFERRDSVILPIEEEGLYEFQVLGMNSYYLLEDYPKRLSFAVARR